MSRIDGIQRVTAYLASTAEQLVRDKALWESPGIKTTPEEFAQMVTNELRQCLENEREQYLTQLNERLAKVSKERKEMEMEFIHVNSASDDSIAAATRGNDEFKVQIESLEGELKALEWRFSRKDQVFQEKLRRKNEEVISINKVVEATIDAQQDLAQQVGRIREATGKLHRGQIRLVRQSKTMVLTQIEESTEAGCSRLDARHSKELARASATLASEKAELASAERQAKAMLDSLEELGVTVCALDDLPRSVETVKHSIEAMIEDRKEQAIERLRREIEDQFQGMSIKGENIADAIEKHVTETIRRKEGECNEILQKGETRERKLRQKLDEAIAKIQMLQNERSDDLRYLDDFERSRRQYEVQQRTLDEKMSALSRKSGDK